MKSPIRWVGGKRRSLNRILPLIPSNTQRIVEPFAGGAAVSFGCDVPELWLNDLNKDLMSFYQLLKESTEPFEKPIVVDLEEYLEIRSSSPENYVERATRFWYLNRTAFNGMWRTNKQGVFNTPVDKTKLGKTITPDLAVLRNSRNRLQDARLTCMDFLEVLELVRNEDFLFLDPPYVDKWDGYQGGFDGNEILANKVRSMSNKFILTNSPQAVDLYGGFNRLNNEVAYVVGGKNASRNKRKEILIYG